MVKLEEMSDGYYVLEVQLGAVTLTKCFMDADKPLEEVSKEPMSDGFRLEIPDSEE